LTRDRPMWDYLRDYGVEEAELNWFLDNPCHQTYWGVTIYTAIACWMSARTLPCFMGNKLRLYRQAVHVAEEPTCRTAAAKT